MNYQIALDATTRTDGESSASILAEPETPNPGTFYQSVDAATLRGKTVQVTADMRSVGAKRRAGLWVRADDAEGHLIGIKQSLLHSPNYDNAGNIEWTSLEVRLDIPKEARTVSYGLTMGGTGRVWIDNVHVESTESSVIAPGAVINVLGLVPEPEDLAAVPSNLSFEERDANCVAR